MQGWERRGKALQNPEMKNWYGRLACLTFEKVQVGQYGGNIRKKKRRERRRKNQRKREKCTIFM